MPVLSYLRDFAPTAQSAFVRRAYARELTGEISLTFPLAMLGPGVVGIIATLLFDVGSFGLATIVAAPMFANLTSSLWARLGLGRSKAKVLAALIAALLLTVVLIALLPAEPKSALALVALYVLARCIFAGVLTTRTVIWRANYPRHSRSRITGRLMLINTLMLATVPIVAATLFDQYQQDYPWLFRAVYLSAASVGVVGVVAYFGLRVRRQRVLRRDELAATIGSADSPDPPIRISALQVLRDDRHFRSYMVWQFCAGVATMAGNTAMIAFIASQVAELPEGWSIPLINLGGGQVFGIKAYLVGIFLASAVMQLFVALSIPFFASYLDKVHVTRFRTRHGTLWIATQVTSFVVAYLAATNGVALGWLLVLLIIPRILQGLVFGGGRLAWQLGHHDFADRHLAATYMAIHQTLTGVRGIIAPFLGVLLYTGYEHFDLLGVHIPAWPGIDYWVFAITAVFAFIGWLGFVRLDQQVGGDGTAQSHD
jgi:MFS family permease